MFQSLLTYIAHVYLQGQYNMTEGKKDVTFEMYVCNGSIDHANTLLFVDENSSVCYCFFADIRSTENEGIKYK